MDPAMSEKLEIQGYTIEDRRYAGPILASEFPGALAELGEILSRYWITEDEIIGGGGGEASQTQRLRKMLSDVGWVKKNVSTTQTVIVADVGANSVADTVEPYVLPSESHEIDHVKRFDSGTLALEIEWNNKDPFFDRDLENFRRLHHIGLVAVGIIVTRGPSLRSYLRKIFVQHYSDASRYKTISDLPGTTAQRKAIFKSMEMGMSLGQAAGKKFFADKYGQATTHWDKLVERVDGRLLGHPCPLLLIGIESQRINSLKETVGSNIYS